MALRLSLGEDNYVGFVFVIFTTYVRKNRVHYIVINKIYIFIKFTVEKINESETKKIEKNKEIH